MTDQASITTPTRRRSFASSGLTYRRVIEGLGLRFCNGSDCTWYKADHERGLAIDWTIHWNKTRITRRGLYEILRRASLLLFPLDTRQQERWLALYRMDQHARALALNLGVRIPKSFGAREKARVRLDLAKIGPLDTEFPEQRELIRRVKAWTRT